MISSKALTAAMNLEERQLPQNIQHALELHQAGQLTSAQALYEEILRVEPKNADAINLLGAIAIQAADPQRAAALFQQAIDIDPSNVTAYCNSGWALWKLGQLDAALARYDQALTLRGDLADAAFNRGNVRRDLRQFEAALASYQQATAIEPEYAEAHLACGHVFGLLKRFEAALESYRKALAAVSDYEEAFLGRGNIFFELKQWNAALASYEQAIAAKPDYAEAHCNCGSVLGELKQWESALACFEQAIALKADYAQAFCNRGIAQFELKQWEAALASYDQAITLLADYAEAYYNRGNVLMQLRQIDAALANFTQAIKCKADYAQAYCNRGNALYELGQWEAALTDYDRATALKPDYSAGHYNRSLMYLLRGEFHKGWPAYEWRWRQEGPSPPEEKEGLSRALWLGEQPLEGKSILLRCEQGLGDTLQFCRYARLVSDLGGRVILEVHDPLKDLLTGLRGVSQIVSRGEVLPPFDYDCPLLSLPLAFNTRLETIPFETRYLNSDAKKVVQWQARLRQKGPMRVGLVWSGSTQHKNDHNRSVLLADLIEHLPADCQYVSLQKEVREADRQTLQTAPGIVQFADELRDFSETAALCDCMDVVISVDTSVAHLSAALGRNTWILLPFVPDWRWLLERKDSPWYPTATLYRQTRAGDWGGVFRKVRSDLQQLLRLASNRAPGRLG